MKSLLLALTITALSVWPSFAAETAPEIAALEALLSRSGASYEKIRDYEAVFKKQERKKDSNKLGVPEIIFMKFEKPFKLFMGWIEGKKKGLQVFYERGKHNNNLVVHVPGPLFAFKPVLFLAQDSPWVQEGGETTYDIEDAGIGTFLADFKEAVAQGKAEGKLEVQFSPDGRTADVRFPNTVKNSAYFASRMIVLFDPNDLPVRMELFDWSNNVTGIYAYEKLRLNVGPGGEAFAKTAHGALKKVYAGK